MPVLRKHSPYLGREVGFGLRLDQTGMPRLPVLRFRDFVRGTFPVPSSYDLSPAAAAVGVYGQEWLNVGPNGIGDCVQAAANRQYCTWRANVGDPYVTPTVKVQAEYSAQTGYVPGDPSTDVGTSWGQLFAYLARTGYAEAGDKLLGWWAINPDDPVEMRTALWLFQGLILGFACPDLWLTSARPGATWDSATPNYNQGHAVFAPSFGPDWLGVSTWGMWPAIRMTNAACISNLSPSVGGSVFALISRAMLFAASQRAPNSLDFPAIEQQLELRIGGPLPMSPVPTKVFLSTVPAQPVAGQPFALGAAAIDSTGKTVDGFAGQSGLVMDAGPGGMSPSSPSVMMLDGLVTFPNIVLSLPGVYQLRVNVPWLNPQVSGDLTVTVLPAGGPPPAPAPLTITLPTDVPAGTYNLTPAPAARPAAKK